ncbi:MAG TPA: SDR family NAD(P)-dependent oxidoreductase [Phnomibacter sp.]|nr:SDR family NAD(P)-dependent oxidoreductase [Phnomibacter sp.]
MQPQYAAITGAAEGLGRSFALACAQQGFNLVLIDLPHHKLDKLALHLAQSFTIDVLVIEQDLCEANAAENIARHIASKQICLRLLVNNAGMGFSKPFQHLDEAQLCKILQLNIQSLTSLTYQLLPLLKQNSEATIINVSSLASFFHLPFKSIYTASKAYVRFFSQSLRVELKPDHIHVCAVCPGAINSNEQQFLTQLDAGWIGRKAVLHPDAVAKQAIEGALAGKAIIIPGFINRLLLMCHAIIPSFISESMLTNSMHRLALSTANYAIKIS